MTAPTFHPPIAWGPDTLGLHVGGAVYDNAGPESPVGGAYLLAGYRLADAIDVSLALQLATEPPRAFLGGGVQGGLRLALSPNTRLGFEMSAECVEGFFHGTQRRQPLLLVTAGTPVSWRLFEETWVWIRPALGAAITVYLLGRGAFEPRFGAVAPALRLSYGASHEIVNGLLIVGESSTSVPHGGAYLGFALVMVI